MKRFYKIASPDAQSLSFFAPNQMSKTRKIKGFRHFLYLDSGMIFHSVSETF